MAKFDEIKVKGFSASKKFYSPDYSKPTDNHARADYRSTIYWNPFVSTAENNQAQVSFYAADLPNSISNCSGGYNHRWKNCTWGKTYHH